MSHPGKISRLRRWFIAGLLIWVPIGITVFIVRLLLELMDRVVLFIPRRGGRRT